MNYPFPNCNSNRRAGKIIGAFLVIWIMGLLPAHAQTAKSPYIGNDSLRIIPLKESVLYLTQWNRLELQSTLYGKDYQPVIMHVSGAKYRMDDKEKNVLWMMPDSGIKKITLRVGKYMKNGIAFKVKDFEFKAMRIKLDIKLKVDGKLRKISPRPIINRIRGDKWAFIIKPDPAMVVQCPETGTYKYWVGEITIYKKRPNQFAHRITLSTENSSFNFHGDPEIKNWGMPVYLDLSIFQTDSLGINTNISDRIPWQQTRIMFRWGEWRGEL